MEAAMNSLIAKAGVLIEALPYIRKFYKKTFVIKYGGAAQTDDKLKEAFASNIVLFNHIGINTVIVHGGGPRISKTMTQMGKSPEFIQGHRVTDKETMDIVEMVLGGLINKEIVSLINRAGGNAVGLTGKDGGLITAAKKLLPSGDFAAPIDIGQVGEVTEINPAIIHALGSQGFIPVIAPIGVSKDGDTLNINADFVASAIAGALKAEKLILLTDTPGILDKTGRTISTIRSGDYLSYMKDGTITGGMLPKMSACLEALNAGVGKIHIIDGRIPNSLLLEIFTQEGIGTEIVV
ncbi:MAG: acetylglutamate kinase [Nitrospirae bacterium]|nr:acetylglutamate kinase [Nitrospirota bacterium]